VPAVRDPYHGSHPPGSEPPFVRRFVTLGRDAVNWRHAVGSLKALGFDGAFSVHTEYDLDESIIRQVGHADSTPPNLEEWVRADAAYSRRIWREV
jgi:sugar phosphate isomerase/epimerase